MYTRWTIEMDEQLVSLLSEGKSLAEAAVIMGIPCSKVTHRARYNRLQSRKTFKWTPKADAKLISLRKQGLKIPAIAAELRTTRGSIIGRVSRLRQQGVIIGRKHSVSWNAEMDAELISLKKKNYTYKAIEERMGIPNSAISRRLSVLAREGKITLTKSTCWTTSMEKKVIELYISGVHSYRKIAAEVGVSEGAVGYKLYQLKKTGRLK